MEQDTPNTVFPQRPEEETTPPPNTRFPQRPQTQGKQDLFKQPARSYYSLLRELTKVGEAITEGTKDFLGSAARGPVEFGKKVVEGVQDNMETAEEGPTLMQIIDRLREIGTEGAYNPGDNEQD